VVENVPTFRRWQLYPLWRSALEALGYDLTEQLLNAADCGVPQERERLIVVGVRDGDAPAILSPGLPRVPASTILDLESGSWSPIRKEGRSAKTLARVEAGRARFGRRFLAPYYSRGSGETGRSLDRPIGTITTKARWSIIDGERMRMLTLEENRRAMGFPGDYVLRGSAVEQLKQLGNAVPPGLARVVVEQVICALPRPGRRGPASANLFPVAA
jgi:DNA (cytosine-5)-methyltransferase 1